jgi:hypothetical protein
VIWNKAWASIKFTSEPGPEPMSAGRIAGSSSAWTQAAQRTPAMIAMAILVEERISKNLQVALTIQIRLHLLSRMPRPEDAWCWG